MTRFRFTWFVLVAPYFCAAAVFGDCVVNDGDFVSADVGCEDLRTGLVWSRDIRNYGVGTRYGFGLDNGFYHQELCDQALNNSEFGGGYTDWRPATLGEQLEALDNGLLSHLDYYWGGPPQFDEYYWGQCVVSKGPDRGKQYAINHNTGDVIIDAFGGHFILCVRGVPRGDDCFGPAGNVSDGGGGGKGGGKGKNAMLLPRSATGSLLLSPLFAVALTCLGRRRRP
jgi:hypothetical protein